MGFELTTFCSLCKPKLFCPGAWQDDRCLPKPFDSEGQVDSLYRTHYTTRMTDAQANYLLGKGGYVFDSVGLFVCLFVSNITQQVLNRL